MPWTDYDLVSYNMTELLSHLLARGGEHVFVCFCECFLVVVVVNVLDTTKDFQLKDELSLSKYIHYKHILPAKVTGSRSFQGQVIILKFIFLVIN